MPVRRLFDETRFHCVLSTKEHYESEAKLSSYDDVLDKFRELKNTLLLKFESLLFIEMARNVGSAPHMCVTCIELTAEEKQ